MNRALLLIAGVVMFVLCMPVVALLAKPGVVLTKTGQQYSGDVTEKDEDILIERNKAQIKVKKSNVDKIEYYDNLEDQYKAELRKLKKDDVAGRIKLARDAFDAHQYLIARVALREAMDIDPNNKEAHDLNEMIGRQMDLEHKTASGGGADSEKLAADEANPKPATQQMPPGDRRLLTPADINIIRQKELRPEDTNVPLRFENNVEQRFATATSQDYRQFRDLKPIEKFIQMQRDRDPRYLQDVKVMRDPSAITEFKRDVQRVVLNGCATSGCHGGNTTSRFMLVNPADNDAATYTNFYLLQSYHQKIRGDGNAGLFGGGDTERGMINRARPEESLLLEYALPPEASNYDHPNIPNNANRGVFKNKGDMRYRQIENWMHNLTTPDPQYGIDFKLTGTGIGTTEPSTRSMPSSTQPSTPAPTTRSAGRP